MADNRGFEINAELFNLPIELGAHIGENLTDKQLVVYSLSSSSSQNFFAIALNNRIKSTLFEFASVGNHEKIKQILIQNPKYLNNEKLMLHLLLHLVAFGQETLVLALLKLAGNPRLLSMKGTVTDYAGNTFEDITLLKYAIWALDRHMWEKLLPYMSEEEVAKQLKEHLSEKHAPEYVKKHGKHFNFAPIQLAYTEFNKLAAEIDFTDFVEDSAEDVKLTNYCKTIVACQQKLPLHVINEFCHTGRSFAEALSAVEPFNEKELPRDTPTVSDTQLYPLNLSFWSENLGLIRGDMKKCIFMRFAYIAKDYTPIDYEAIRELELKRMREFADLKNRYKIIPEVEQSHSQRH